MGYIVSVYEGRGGRGASVSCFPPCHTTEHREVARQSGKTIPGFPE